MPVGFKHRFDKDPFAALYVLEENGQFWLYRVGRPGRFLIEVVSDESIADLERYGVSGLGVIDIVDGVMFVSAAEYIVDDMWRQDLGPAPSGKAPRSDLAMGVETGRYRITFYEPVPSICDRQMWPLDRRRVQRWSLIAILVAAIAVAIWSLIYPYLGAAGTGPEDWQVIGSSAPFQQFLAASLISVIAAFLLVRCFQVPDPAADQGHERHRSSGRPLCRCPDVVIVLTRLGEAAIADRPGRHTPQR